MAQKVEQVARATPYLADQFSYIGPFYLSITVTVHKICIQVLIVCLPVVPESLQSVLHR